MEDLVIEVDADAKLLDQIDPVFGWAGCSHLFENFWMILPDEVAESIDNAWEAARQKSEDWLKKKIRKFQMTFKDQLKIDAKETFLNPEEFGVSAVYEPFSGGSSVNLVVVPSGSAFIADQVDTAGQSLTLAGAVEDVAAPELNSKITLSTGEVCKILNIISIDSAIWVVNCIADERIAPSNMR